MIQTKYFPDKKKLETSLLHFSVKQTLSHQETKLLKSNCLHQYLHIQEFLNNLLLQKTEEQENDQIRDLELCDYILLPNIAALGVKKLWEKGFTGKGVLIGVLDTGIGKHPDLEDRVVIRKSYTKQTLEPTNVHGTHVAGTIAANGLIRGVAYEANLADYRVLANNGTGKLEDVITAIYDAVKDGCDILNLSLGISLDYPPLKAALQHAKQNNVVVVAAAGNEGDGCALTDEISYPAAYPSVISVASVNNKSVSLFSNSNKYVDCCALGENILSTGLKEQYTALTGTSMACPHVTGCIAIIIQQMRMMNNESYTVEDIEQSLYKNIRDSYLPGKDNSTGLGFVTFHV